MKYYYLDVKQQSINRNNVVECVEVNEFTKKCTSKYPCIRVIKDK